MEYQAPRKIQTLTAENLFTMGSHKASHRSGAQLDGRNVNTLMMPPPGLEGYVGDPGMASPRSFHSQMALPMEPPVPFASPPPAYTFQPGLQYPPFSPGTFPGQGFPAAPPSHCTSPSFLSVGNVGLGLASSPYNFENTHSPGPINNHPHYMGVQYSPPGSPYKVGPCNEGPLVVSSTTGGMYTPPASRASGQGFISPPPGFPLQTSTGLPLQPPPGLTHPIFGPFSPVMSPLPFPQEKLAFESRRSSISGLYLEPVETSANTVKLIAGNQDFLVHRDLLCYYSPYFRKIFNPVPDAKVKKAHVSQESVQSELGQWWEPDEAGGAKVEEKVEVDIVVRLPTRQEFTIDVEEFGNVSPEVIWAFLDYLYNGYDGFGLNDNPNNHHHVSCQTLIELFVFAERVGVPACQNACIEAIEMWRQNTNIIQTLALPYIYENTKPDSPLRRLLIDQCTYNLDLAWARTVGEEELPHHAMVDILDHTRKLMYRGVAIGGQPRPFENPAMRRELYWVPVTPERVEEVLSDWR